MRVRRDRLEIKGVGEFDPVILCMRLKINTEDWQGLPLENWISAFKNKKNLPGLESERESEKEPPEKESAEKEIGKENENEAGGSYSQAVCGQKSSTDEDGFVLRRIRMGSNEDKS
ncbi:unnamed protein product [Cylicostephanus goldi]|uniref:Uncharacterized protein n=1 Tax=Cylicostephanus goldi TaxID=71465 RepID=A0A3P6R492_CYLGO|nr:unnamed protein product [Cylicostephanus goldi]